MAPWAFLIAVSFACCSFQSLLSNNKKCTTCVLLFEMQNTHADRHAEVCCGCMCVCYYDGWHAHQIFNPLHFCLFCTDSQELPDLVENLGSDYNTTDVLQAPPTYPVDTNIPFVGRKHELGIMIQAFNANIESHQSHKNTKQMYHFVTISGSVGQGKSRLAVEGCSHWHHKHEEGQVVLHHIVPGLCPWRCGSCKNALNAGLPGYWCRCPGPLPGSGGRSTGSICNAATTSIQGY